MLNELKDQHEPSNSVAGLDKEQAQVSRRRLIKGAATVAPVILTLRSGSVLAAISGCTASPLNPSNYQAPTGDQVCLGYTPTEGDNKDMCSPGALYSAAAATSLLSSSCL